MAKYAWAPWVVNLLRVRSTPCLPTALRLLHSIRNVACVAFITRLVDCVHVSSLGCSSSRACADWERKIPRAAVEALTGCRKGRSGADGLLNCLCACQYTAYAWHEGKSTCVQKGGKKEEVLHSI